MKSARHIITSLLSVYLLVLMAMPCSDHHSHTNTLAETKAVQDAGHRHEAGLCTPFCACACCASPIVLLQSIEFEALQFGAQSGSRTGSFYKSVTSFFFGSIWQPPQLA